MFNLRIAVAGAVSIDICPQLSVKNADDFSDIIIPGKITQISGNVITPGGPVANTGIALRLFGLWPLLCAKIGRDNFGKVLYEMLNRQSGSMSTDTIAVSDDSHTAYSIILAAEGLDRAILQNPGANDDFEPSDINWHIIKKCRLLHFGHPSSMRRMYEDDGKALTQIMKTAKEHGLLTSLDLCAVDPGSPAGSCDWKKILKNVLPYIDFFMPSIGDLDGVFFPCAASSEESITEERLIDLAKEAAETSTALGAGCTLIKLGDKGMYYDNPSGDFFRNVERKLSFMSGSMKSWEDRTGHIPAVKAEKYVSGLGAGDTCIAAYLTSLMHGYDFDTTLRLSLTEGALCVTEPSAVGGLVPLNELL